MSTLLFILIIGAFVIMQGRVYGKRIFDKLYISRGFDCEAVFPGDKIVYELSLENRKLLPLTWLHIEEEFHRGIEFEVNTKIVSLNDETYVHKTMLSLLPFQKVVRRYNLRAEKRGYYQLKFLMMTSTNILGTEEYSQNREVAANIAVYPTIRDLRGAIIPANTIQGDFSVKRWIIEDPMIITGVRSYSGNDSLRSINWKATAKNQQLLVNKYDFTADKKIMIILNLERQEYSLRVEDIENIESAVEVCASIAAMLQEAGIPYGFATNSQTIGPIESNILEPDTGDKHMASVLEAMAKVSYFKKYKSRELLKLMVSSFSWGTEVIVVTPEVSEILVGDLQSLNNVKTTVVSLSVSAVNVPSNIELYYYRKEGEQYEVV